MTRFYRSLVPLLLFGLLLVGCDSGGSSAPSNLGDSTSVGFVETAATVVEGEDGTYDLEMVTNDPGFEEVRFDLSINDSQSSATLGEDVTGLTGDTTVTFPSSATSDETISIPLGIVDEPVDSTGFLEDSETLSMTLSPADSLGPEEIEQGTMNFTLTIEEEDEPFTVAESRARPAGKRTVVDALVTRVTPDGVYAQDGTGGLFVFDSDFASNVSKGDSVRLDGSVQYFSGLYQVSGVNDGPVTEKISSGNSLPAPQNISLSEVVNNGEEYESELVRVESFTIDDKGDDTFQGGGTDGNYPISTANATSTLRIPGNSEWVGEEIPGRASFEGVLGQFNGGFGGADEPDEGYQLLAFSISELEILSTTYDVVANASDLQPASGNTDAHCTVQRSTGEVVFFNSTDGGIFSYDSGLNVERSASDLNSDISAESNTINRCDGVAKDGNDNVYFLFRADANSDGTTYVYKLPASGSPVVLGSEAGLGGVVHDNGTVYLAGVAFDGAPEDGFYSVNDTGAGQSVSTVVTDANLDLGYGMDVDSDGNLYAFSGGFGGTASRTLKIVRVTNPSGSAAIEEFVDPYRSGSPLVDNGDNILDVDVATKDGNEFLVVYNASFSAQNGEQWGSIRISDQSISLLFNQTRLVGNTSADGYTGGFTEPMAVSADGDIFVASRDGFGATDYIAKVGNSLP